MYKKFCVVLFVTIFCHGVTYSSPAKEIVTEVTPKEKQVVSTEVVGQTSHKDEPSTAVPDNGTHHIETPAVKNSSNHSQIVDKTIPKDSTAVVKSISQGSDVGNDTRNSTAAVIKIPDASLNANTNATSKPTGPIAVTVPVTNNKTTTDLPPASFSDMARPIAPGDGKTTPVTTLAASTTTKAPVTKPAVVTSAPTTAAVSTSTDNVLLEHNSPSKDQGSRFDGASFVGGIVLTIGLTAIGFIAFKFYKSGKIDANYRTL